MLRCIPCDRRLPGQPHVRTAVLREPDPDTGRVRRVKRIVAIEAHCTACGDSQRVSVRGRVVS